MLEPNPYSPSEQKLGEGLVIGNDRRASRRMAAFSIAFVTMASLLFFVTWVQFELLEIVFASAVWIIVCLPMAVLVDRWGIIGFVVGIPVCMILTPVAFFVSFGVAIAFGIEVMPVPN